MPKLTRRIKKNRKNLTIKRGGDVSKEEKHGVIDIIGDKLSNVAFSAAKTAADTGLKIVGLERINNSEEQVTKQVDNNIEKIGDAASGIISDVKNVADKTGAAIIENVNEVLGSDAVKETTEQAAENTAELIKEGAEQFNEALNDPEVKSEIKEAIENAGEIGTVIVNASKEPFNEVVDIASEAVPKITSAAVSGAIKVGTDALAALPGIGAIFDIGKMINDGSKAASSIVEAGSEAIEVASDSFIETKENVEKGLKELEEKKKLAQQISNRTTKSINQFENPLSKSAVGGRKTRRRLIKRKGKSKRVRFNF